MMSKSSMDHVHRCTPYSPWWVLIPTLEVAPRLQIRIPLIMRSMFTL